MEEICRNCEHFIVHYVKSDGSFVEIFAGHCVYPAIKDRKSDQKACKHFVERTEKEEEKILHITLKCKYI